jgi:hypothetical protein
MSTRICGKGFPYCVKDREERDGFRSIQKGIGYKRRYFLNRLESISLLSGRL